VYRHDADRDAKVARNDAAAVTVTEECVEKGWDLKVPSPQQVFLLMPFRHTQKTLPRLRRALEALDARQVWDWHLHVFPDWSLTVHLYTLAASASLARPLVP